MKGRKKKGKKTLRTIAGDISCKKEKVKHGKIDPLKVGGERV